MHMSSCVCLCVLMCVFARMCHGAWWKSGEQWDQFSPSHHPGLEWWAKVVRFVGWCLSAEPLGQPQIHVFKMSDFLYWSIGDWVRALHMLGECLPSPPWALCHGAVSPSPRWAEHSPVRLYRFYLFFPLHCKESLGWFRSHYAWPP